MSPTLAQLTVSPGIITTGSELNISINDPEDRTYQVFMSDNKGTSSYAVSLGTVSDGQPLILNIDPTEIANPLMMAGQGIDEGDAPYLVRLDDGNAKVLYIVLYKLDDLNESATGIPSGTVPVTWVPLGADIPISGSVTITLMDESMYGEPGLPGESDISVLSGSELDIAQEAFESGLSEYGDSNQFGSVPSGGDSNVIDVFDRTINSSTIKRSFTIVIIGVLAIVGVMLLNDYRKLAMR